MSSSKTRDWPLLTSGRGEPITLRALESGIKEYVMKSKPCPKCGKPYGKCKCKK